MLLEPVLLDLKPAPKSASSLFTTKPLPKGGEIVPYRSPGPNSLTNAAGQRLLPPVGETTPPYGFRVQPNTLTNTKPNLGPPINFKPGGAKGNFNIGGGSGGGGGGGGGGGTAARVGLGVAGGTAARVGLGAAVGAAAAPYIVGVAGFAAGLNTGTDIYLQAENPDSIVFKGIDFIDRKLKGDNSYKLGNETKIRSAGGVEISPEILPFRGGQTQNTYLVSAHVGYTVYNGDGSVAGSGTGYAEAYAVGPISSIYIKQEGRQFRLTVKGGANSEQFGSYLDWAIDPYRPLPIANRILGTNIYRTDGTSLQQDIVQGGNPTPDQVGTYEPPTTVIIDNSVTNNVTNNYPEPPPFADPPPRIFPPPPAIKPNPVPNPVSNPVPNPVSNPAPNPVSGPITNGKPNITPGSYPAPNPNSSTGLGPTTRISGGTTSGSSGPSGQTLPAPNAPAPFAEPPEPGKFTALPPLAIPAPTTAGSSSTANGLAPVNNGQVVNAPQSERERVGFPVEETGGSCCALPAIQSGNNQILDRLNGLNNAAQDALLLEVLNRLGPQVAGGLSGWLGRFSRSLHLDRVLNVLQFMLVVHNAGMLSRSLVDSISYLIDSAGQAFGLRDEDDKPIDLTGTIGKSVSSYLEGILGAELYAGLSFNWKKLSAIYTSAVNVYQLTTNSMAGIAEGLETVGNYTGRIGNALKRGGVIIENSYQWMNENFSIKSGKFAAIQKVTDGISQADSIVNDLTSVTEEIIETTENITQIQNEFKTIKDNFKDIEEKRIIKEDKARTDSLSPNIERENLLEAPEENATTN